MPWHLSQVEAAALSVVHVLRFRAELVRETLPVETLAGQPLCMAQYERMYNSCRVPGEECDSIVTYSGDKRHIIVLRNNYILAVEVLDEAGAIKPISDIIRQLEDCIELSSSPFDLESHPPVSVLTSEDRTVWAKVRCEVTQAGCTSTPAALLSFATRCAGEAAPSRQRRRKPRLAGDGGVCALLPRARPREPDVARGPLRGHAARLGPQPLVRQTVQRDHVR